MIFLFRFDIKDNGIEFVLNDAISHDIDTNAYVDVEIKMLPLVKSIAELLLPYRQLSVSRTILNYEILDTKEQEVMLSKGLGIHIALPIKNEIFSKSQQLAALLIEIINRQSKLEASQQEQHSQSDEGQLEKPIIHPISMLPVISDLIKGSLKGAKDQYATLIPCKNQPHVLDDETVNRVIKLYISEQEFVGIYNEQFAIWEKEKLTPFQKSEIAKLKVSVKEWDKIIKDILTLSNELSKGTIDKIIAMDDFELGSKVLSGEIPGTNYMKNGKFNNLTPEHLNIALEIDRKFTELEKRGYDYALIFVEMGDLMPKFKKLMDELRGNDFDQLTLQFSGFYGYAKFIEWVAAQIASGEIKVPR